jgi:hypothetical protein
MSKRERIEQYNDKYGYQITGIKKVSSEHIRYMLTHGASSLDELYKTYSNAKRESFEWIVNTYKPLRIGLQGNCMTYSAILEASNGDFLWITRDNNYLLEVTA